MDIDNLAIGIKSNISTFHALWNNNKFQYSISFLDNIRKGRLEFKFQHSSTGEYFRLLVEKISVLKISQVTSKSLGIQIFVLDLLKAFLPSSKGCLCTTVISYLDDDADDHGQTYSYMMVLSHPPFCIRKPSNLQWKMSNIIWFDLTARIETTLNCFSTTKCLLSQYSDEFMRALCGDSIEELVKVTLQSSNNNSRQELSIATMLKILDHHRGCKGLNLIYYFLDYLVSSRIILPHRAASLLRILLHRMSTKAEPSSSPTNLEWLGTTLNIVGPKVVGLAVCKDFVNRIYHNEAPAITTSSTRRQKFQNGWQYGVYPVFDFFVCKLLEYLETTTKRALLLPSLIGRVQITPLNSVVLPCVQSNGNNFIFYYLQQDHHNNISPFQAFTIFNFVDSNFSKLTKTSLQTHGGKKKLNGMVERTLASQGVWVGTHQYRFFMGSNIAMDQCHVWGYSTRYEKALSDIIGTKIPGLMAMKPTTKRLSRFGMLWTKCLSIWQPTPTLRVLKIEDIVTKDQNSSCFSDGCGLMNLNLASQIRDHLNLPYLPSAVQIRFAGYKGVLVLESESDKTQRKQQNMVRPGGAVLSVRPSMFKFSSADKRTLGIVKPAQLFETALNRQIIIILHTLGVQDKILLGFVKDFIATKEKVFVDAKFALNELNAPPVLQHHQSTFDLKEIEISLDSDDGVSSLSDSIKKIVQIIQTLVHKGFLASTPPDRFLLCILLEQFKIRIYRGLSNGIITLSRSHGLCLMGVVDTTQSLKPNQIFIQLEEDTYQTTTILVEKVVVFRLPCLLSSDALIVDTVDVPQLHHLKNVIVFSAKGKQSVLNKLSGGSDLDGDCYHIFRGDLVPPTRSQHGLKSLSPSSSSKIKRKTKEEEYIMKAIIKDEQEEEKQDEREEIDEGKKWSLSDFVSSNARDFETRSSCTNELGKLARVALAIADSSDSGCDDPDVKLLASLHEKAVDFPKTGKQIWLPHKFKTYQLPYYLLDNNKNCDSQKDRKNPQRKSLFAHIYDLFINSVTRQRSRLNDLHRACSYDPRFLVKDFYTIDYQDFAEAAYLKYKNVIESILASFHLKREEELFWSDNMHTWLVFLEGLHKIRKELVDLQMENVVHNNTKTQHQQKLASAYYYHSYYVVQSQNSSNVPLLSFPWMFAGKQLFEILEQQSSFTPTPPIFHRRKESGKGWNSQRTFEILQRKQIETGTKERKKPTIQKSSSSSSNSFPVHPKRSVRNNQVFHFHPKVRRTTEERQLSLSSLPPLLPPPPPLISLSATKSFKTSMRKAKGKAKGKGKGKVKIDCSSLFR